MKDIVLYAYSTDVDFLDLLKFLLSKVEAKISTCIDEVQLKKIYKKSPPNILLLDDNASEDNPNSTTINKIIESYLIHSQRGSSMVVVLSTKASNVEYKVNILLNGADYIIEKPLNMMELIARIIAIVRHQQFVHKTLEERIYQVRNIAAYDSMEKMFLYLNERIKPIAETFMQVPSFNLNDADAIKNYTQEIQEGSIQIMAVLNAIRNDVHELMVNQTNYRNDWDHLDQLFKKNLELIHMAYRTHINTDNNEK